MIVAVAAAGILFNLTPEANAATRTWNAAGATSVDWATPGNWQEGFAPVNGDDVSVSAGGTFNPTGYNGAQVNSLALTGSTNLSISGVSVGAGGVFNNTAAQSFFLTGTTTLLADSIWGGTRTIFTTQVTGNFKITANNNASRWESNSPNWTGGLDVRTDAAMANNFAAGTITPWGTGTITMINQKLDGVSNTNARLNFASNANNITPASPYVLENNIVLSDPGTLNYAIQQATNMAAAGDPHYYELSGNITGAVNSARTLSFTNIYSNAATTPAVFTLTGTNTYAAQTVIGTNTTLQIGKGGLVGTLGSNTGNITNNGTLAINRSNAVSVANVITGAGAFAQRGVGTTTLSGDNNYTGTTTVAAGTLLINGNQSSATGDVSVAVGATLGGTGTIGGAMTVSGTISPGNSAGNLTLNNGLTLDGDYLWELASLSTTSPGTNFDTITVTAGNVNITGASMSLNLGAFAPSAVPFWETDQTWAGILNNTGAGTLTGTFAAIDNTSWSSLGSFTTTYTGNDVNLQWTAIPEPSSAILILGSCLALVLARRRRR